MTTETPTITINGRTSPDNIAIAGRALADYAAKLRTTRDVRADIGTWWEFTGAMEELHRLYAAVQNALHERAMDIGHDAKCGSAQVILPDASEYEIGLCAWDEDAYQADLREERLERRADYIRDGL